MKYNKTVFGFTTLLNANLWGFKDPQKHFLNLGITHEYGLNATQATGIAFSELKPEKNQLLTEN